MHVVVSGDASVDSGSSDELWVLGAEVEEVVVDGGIIVALVCDGIFVVVAVVSSSLKNV